ncbi:MAG: TonB family protein [Polyangiaceae bacterium]
MSSLLSPIALTLSFSIAAHTGLAVLAYAHSSGGVPPRVDTPTALEVSITDPDPVVEPPSYEVRTTTPAVAVARPLTAARAARADVATTHEAAATDSAAAAMPVESAEPVAPRFVMQAPIVAGSSAPAALSGLSNERESGADLPFAEGQVDSPAKLQSGTPPTYTAAAEAAGVEVELPLEVVIDRTGAVQSARTLEHVGYGLDEAAVAAVRRYRFSPAHRGGSAVSVRMRWVLRFQLR